MRLPNPYLAPCLLCCALTACTAYHAASLVTAPPPHAAISVSGPISLSHLAELAVLNDPDLLAARAQHAVAAAVLLSAGLPPDPSITGGFGALLGGPGTMPAIIAGVSQDLGSLITYSAERQGAAAGLAQVDAGILWQEWQVASQAEQLAVTLSADQQIITSLQQDIAVLGPINAATQQQIALANQTAADSALSQAALATAQAALNTAEQNAAHDTDQLDALLALQPGTAIPLAPIALAPPDAATIAPAIASLAQRRPDLIALRYGYTQADARLRAAVLSQFLPISLGVSGGRDTTGVTSVGPQVTLTLPLFNRNRGAIAAASATRAALAAQYSASLSGAADAAQALYADIILLQSELGASTPQAAQAAAAGSARQAFTAGEITAPAFAALQTVASDRERTAISLRAQLQSAEISLATMLGLGLPPLAPSSEYAAE